MIAHLISAGIIDGAAPTTYIEPSDEAPEPITVGATISAGGYGTVTINTRLNKLHINVIKHRWPTR